MLSGGKTKGTTLSIRTWGLGLLAAAALAAGTLIPATGALASPAGNPNPQPTCTQDTQTGSPTPFALGYGNPCPTPTPTPQPCDLVVNGIPQPLSTVPATRAAQLAACRNIRQEDFGGTDTNLTPNGFVTADGPIRFGPFVFGLRGRDFRLSPTTDLFRAAFGSVIVHSVAWSAADITVDPLACTIRVSQSDDPWYVRSGQGFGIYRFAQGAGTYDLSAVFSYRTADFACPVAAVTPAQAAWDLNAGRGLPTPLDYGVTFDATGWASPTPHLLSYVLP